MYRKKNENPCSVHWGKKNKKIRHVLERQNIKKTKKITQPVLGRKKQKKHAACIGKSTDISEYFVMGRAQIIILITL